MTMIIRIVIYVYIFGEEESKKMKLYSFYDIIIIIEILEYMMKILFSVSLHYD